MKNKTNILLHLIFILGTSEILLAQNNSNPNPNPNSNSNPNSNPYSNTDNFCVKKDDIIIDAFYGWPYFNGILLQSISNSNNLSSVRNTNHLGGKVEFMLTDEIGLGGEFTWADASIRYQSTTTGLYETAGVNKIRILARFNYHFAATRTIDPYGSIGLGYKRTTLYDSSVNGINETFNLIPISFKMAVGMRVYLTDLVGLNFELGLGGPLLTGGLNIKI